MRRVFRAIGQGLWVLMPVYSIGILGWLPAGQAWWRTRSSGWLAATVLLAAGGVGVLLRYALGSDNDVFVMIFLATAVAGVATALKARPVVFARREETVELPPYEPDSAAVPAAEDHPAVREVLAGRERRRQAREIVARDPAMALELSIGRPDARRSYDDGGLVDLNNAGADGLATALGWPIETAEAFVVARDLRGGYASLDEVAALSGLETALLDRDAERIVLLPHRTT
ncbi:hypothetical protein [Jiangella alkaliphila]|uniref:Helix-hairpin-helix motif-containing protein n=1 Tax=Jiangella alkaliphila TaxID=419479 RepID=A0A1H2L0G5_9ACTN|nr:hypothetical protein [Jiangella alkaliphila]SDU74547.1 hypothetical protein SAMN04488563_4766 [Jiangella alkaliphila]